MKTQITMLALFLALNAMGQTPRYILAKPLTIKPNQTHSEALAERLDFETKWDNYVLTQPNLRLLVQQLDAHYTELNKAKATLEHLSRLDDANTMAVTGEKHLRYGGSQKLSKFEQGKASSRHKEIAKARARVNQLKLNAGNTTGLLKIERIKWEKAMEKQ